MSNGWENREGGKEEMKRNSWREVRRDKEQKKGGRIRGGKSE